MINLIPLAYLNEVCFLSLNEDDKKYQIHLEEAQEDLSDLLGAEFYEEIETQYDAGTLTTDNDALYEDTRDCINSTAFCISLPLLPKLTPSEILARILGTRVAMVMFLVVNS